MSVTFRVNLGGQTVPFRFTTVSFAGIREIVSADITQDINARAAKAASLSDLASASEARTNLGGTATGVSLFTAASASAARTAIGGDLASNVSATYAGTGGETLDLQTVARLTPIVTGYRAVADVDDTLAFQRLSAVIGTNGHATVPKGSYSLASPFSILSGQKWDFNGSLLTNTDATSALISCDGINDWSIKNARLVGTRTAAETNATDIGIVVANGKRYLIDSVNLTGFRSRGLDFSGATAPGNRGDRGIIANPIITNCDYGINASAGAGAEFNSVSNPQISGCGTGVALSAGNWQVTGGTITDNGVNVYLGSGSNHGHGVFSGVAISHATTYAIHADGVILGYTFTGCPIYEGDILLDGCKGIVITGGVYAGGVIYNAVGTGSGYNYLRGIHVVSDYGGTSLDAGVGFDPSYIIVSGLTGLPLNGSGLNINDPAEVYVHARRMTTDGTQAMSTDTVASLIFPNVESNAVRRGAYDETTGVFTVPAGMAGQYKLAAEAVFSGTSITANGSYGQIRIVRAGPTASEEGYFPAGDFGSSLVGILYSRNVYLEAGDTVAFRASINGTPAFGSGSFMSSMSIEKIA